MPNHDRGQGLAASLVGAIETAQIRAVHVQHAQQPFAVQQRNDQFRTRCGIASNMTGKGFDIRYENGPALARGGAADASSQRNPNTGGLPLEWTEDQFFTSHKIEACPVQCGQAMKDRGCRVRGISGTIGLPGEERIQRFGEVPIRGGFFLCYPGIDRPRGGMCGVVQRFIVRRARPFYARRPRRPVLPWRHPS
jgi:hypothetical protein